VRLVKLNSDAWVGDNTKINAARYVTISSNGKDTAVTVVAGAGGLSVDFDGRPLRARRLAAGRTSIVHAANEPLCQRLLKLVTTARGHAKIPKIPS